MRDGGRPPPSYNDADTRMTIEPASPRFPLHETLARFFRLDPRRHIPLAELAHLLGTTDELTRAMLRSEGGRRVTGSVSWSDAVGYLFDAWPRARILDVLGDDAQLIPAAAHPTRVQWSIPIFIARAMEHQSALAWKRDPRVRSSVVTNDGAARGVDDYVADLLFNEIQPETLAAFETDSGFLQAYHYPSVD